MTPPKPVDLERRCTADGCGKLYADHKAGTCPFCNGPLDHHPPGRMEACREGRARMARARQAAGSDLDAADLLALESEPAA